MPTKKLMTHSLFKALAPDQVEALSVIATQVRFGLGESIFRQREVADGFYLIDKGVVSLEYELPGKRKVEIQTIGPGELLGLSWLFEPYRWQFSATAIKGVTANFFRAVDVREQCARDPKLGYKLMEEVARVLTERLQATRHKLLVFVERASDNEDARQVC
ncbi:MAG TPA: cyclic nucleotide-binding domain-containing protein [Chthoniobacterales bacterium]